MKRYLLQSLLLMAGTALLGACGGGGDDAGSPTAFSLVPNSIKVTGATTGACAAGTTGEVFVYGGVAPYRIDNTVPGYVSFDKTTVEHKGDSFTVTFLGGCLNPGQIVIVDKMDKQVILTLTNEKGT